MNIDAYITGLDLKPWQRIVHNNLRAYTSLGRTYGQPLDTPLRIIGLLTLGQTTDTEKLYRELQRISSSSHSFFGDLVAWYNEKGLVQVTFSFGTRPGKSVEDVFVPPSGVHSLDEVTEKLPSRYHPVEVRKYPLSLVSERKGRIHRTDNYL